MGYANEREICVCALQRSGHHAIIEWILDNTQGPACFLNKCWPSVSPYASGNNADSVWRGTTSGVKKLRQQLSCLIYNYEDAQLEEIFYEGYWRDMRRWVGSSRLVKTVLVLRDPFNTFASKYRWYCGGRRWPPSRDAIERLPALWKSHAREFLGETTIMPRDTIHVSFNEWTSNSSYRARLADELNLESSDRGGGRVAWWGPVTWGDAAGHADRRAPTASELSLRWRAFEDDPLFRSLFRDDELWRLSRSIFSDLEGTDTLRLRCADATAPVDWRGQPQDVKRSTP